MDATSLQALQIVVTGVVGIAVAYFGYKTQVILKETKVIAAETKVAVVETKEIAQKTEINTNSLTEKLVALTDKEAHARGMKDEKEKTTKES